jgi:hypothetical protein
MRLTMPLVFVALAAMGGSAAAQGVFPPPPPPGQPPVSVFPQPAQNEQGRCEIPQLFQDAMARAGQIKAASERKAGFREVCELFRDYVNAETKLVSYVEKRPATCTISLEFMNKLKANQKRSNEAMESICKAASRQLPGDRPLFREDPPPLPPDQRPFRVLRSI